MSEAFVTLSTNDSYCLGALVLAHSLRNVNTTRKLVILITPEVTEHMRTILAAVYDVVKIVDVINSQEEEILSIMKRPELGVTLTKLHCWRLTEYTKCIFMDADTLCVKNIDELFERDELSAVSDIGWPDCFNTGLYVYKPSEKTFNELSQLLSKEGTFDGGDQGLLNSFFSDWASADITKRLSFIYNMSSIAVYSYPPAYKRFGDKVKVIHFLGSLKPWMYGYSRASGKVIQTTYSQKSPEQLEHIQKWWNVFMSKVQSQLSPECQETILCHDQLPKVINKTGIAANLSPANFSQCQSEYYGAQGEEVDESTRKKNWETGNVDYLGSDRFENIQKKLDDVIGQ